MPTIESLPLIIRPFDKSRDYSDRARLHNASFPDRAVTEQELRNWDSKEDPDPKYLSRHMMGELEIDGRREVVSYLWFGHRPGIYHPRKPHFTIEVHPDHRRKGVGTAMYRRVLEGIRPLEPLQLMTVTFENQPAAVEFLTGLGFVERMRAWESHLDVPSFDPAPFQGVFERLTAEGIVIRSEAELADDPEFERKLYEMFVEVLQDVPAPDPITPQSFERFKELRRDDINRIPEAYFIAVHEASGEFAGTTALWRLHAAKHLSTGLTGVRRAFRRKGIALALKLRAIEYARSVGAPSIRTDNESGNRPMLSINEMLGFKRGTAELAMVKEMT